MHPSNEQLASRIIGLFDLDPDEFPESEDDIRSSIFELIAIVPESVPRLFARILAALALNEHHWRHWGAYVEHIQGKLALAARYEERAHGLKDIEKVVGRETNQLVRSLSPSQLAVVVEWQQWILHIYSEDCDYSDSGVFAEDEDLLADMERNLSWLKDVDASAH